MSPADDDARTGSADPAPGSAEAGGLPEGVPADWDGHALSKRGYVLMAVIPFLGAALLFGLVTLNYERVGTDTATSVRLPTNSWLPGQAEGTSAVEGELTAGDGGCVYLAASDGTTVWPVWPAGWTAKESSSGVISIYDDSSDLIARTGTSIVATGTPTTSTDFTASSCAADADSSVLIQSEVAREG
ncbi:hypothetical protein [Nocardioides sp. GY 10127]|uniref:hypothetical protein n=1 Tax=Nocardioides sp. GY 10127 TaxID=2569762 RepID=UPI0010A9087C|nr:hypothetical protein [Nocardioides sp. GY 10127]TIC84306.1 hypothetical protein E8D37_05900 [Nocardioides sp. GY 10127]